MLLLDKNEDDPLITMQEEQLASFFFVVVDKATGIMDRRAIMLERDSIRIIHRSISPSALKHHMKHRC